MAASKTQSLYCFWLWCFLGNQHRSPPSHKQWEGTCPQAETSHPHRVSTGARGALGSWGGVEEQRTRTRRWRYAWVMAEPLPSSLGSEQAIAKQITCSPHLVPVLTSTKPPYSRQAPPVCRAHPPLGWAGHAGRQWGCRRTLEGQRCEPSNWTPPNISSVLEISPLQHIKSGLILFTRQVIFNKIAIT